MLLEKVKALHSQNPQNSQLKALRPSLLRSAFTVGLLCKHFDVDSFMPASTQVSQTERTKSLLFTAPPSLLLGEPGEWACLLPAGVLLSP